MNACLWCDAPTEERLCPSCRAVNDHPLFHCAVNTRHTPTLGDHCAECAWIAEAKTRSETINASILDALRSIRARHIAEWHHPWPGLEFGKAAFGMMVDAAIRDVSRR